MRPDWHVAEVSREKAGADGLSLVYERMRGSGKSFTEHTEREYNGAIRGRLGPLIDPAGASAHYRSLFENAQREFMTGEFPNDDRIFGPEVSRFQNFGTTLQFCEVILNDNPELMDPKRRIGFLRSTELRRCPALMYPSLIYSGLALTRGRKARPSDRYDRTHLTKGLSRCDVVTTDPGMAQMLRERGLVPKDVKLFSSREHDSLLHYFEGLAQENRND